MNVAPILPGATVGVLGSGQLGRMFAIAARRLGYRVHTFSPDYDTPTGQIADLEVRKSYDDLDAVRDFAANVDVVTFEFENVSHACAEAAARMAPVRPAGSVLHTTQHRKREKQFLARQGLPVAEFAVVDSLAGLRDAVARIGTPAVLKTAGFGYDGKGQTKITADSDLEAAWQGTGRTESILEAFVEFECEVSVIAARGADGAMEHFGVVRNDHAHHILDVSSAPAAVSEAVHREAIDITRTVMEALEVVGVLSVEFFLTRSGRLVVNELAPRPHNSGHFTVDACLTSQFEQQLRAVCGLPLGSPELLRPAAMANLLGDLWSPSQPPHWEAALAMPDVKLHLYGKTEARPRRKMGHLTAMAATAGEAAMRVRAARQALIGRS